MGGTGLGLPSLRSTLRNQQAGCQPDAAVLPPKERASTVLYYAAAFLIIALLAGALGFGGIAGSATVIAQVLFLVFLTLAGLSLIVRESRRLEQQPPVD